MKPAGADKVNVVVEQIVIALPTAVTLEVMTGLAGSGLMNAVALAGILLQKVPLTLTAYCVEVDNTGVVYVSLVSPLIKVSGEVVYH